MRFFAPTRWLLYLLAIALILTGCGGGTKTVTAKLVPPAAAAAVATNHPCNPQDQVMQCVLPAPPPLAFGAPFGVKPIAQGVDFAWGGPSCATLKANGWSFGASYLSYDTAKNWSHAQFADYVRNGCKVVFVWETLANRTTMGRFAGISDATEALRQYRTYIPHGRVAITFGIDCDCTIGQVRAYFQGADSYLWPRAGRNSVNAYGGYYPVTALCREHLVGSLNWPTYAWSGGQWPAASCGPLEQWLNGSSVDYDRAIAVDYGQYPPPNIVVPVAVDKYHTNWYVTNVTHNGRSERKTVQLIRGARQHPVKYAGWIHVLKRDLAYFAERLDIQAQRRGEINCTAAYPIGCPHVWDTQHKPPLHQGFRAYHEHAAVNGAPI